MTQTPPSALEQGLPAPVVENFDKADLSELALEVRNLRNYTAMLYMEVKVMNANLLDAKNALLAGARNFDAQNTEYVAYSNRLAQVEKDLSEFIAAIAGETNELDNN